MNKQKENMEEQTLLYRTIEVKINNGDKTLWVSDFKNNATTVTIILTDIEEDAKNFIQTKKFFGIPYTCPSEAYKHCKDAILNSGMVKYIITHTTYNNGIIKDKKYKNESKKYCGGYIMTFGKYKGCTLEHINDVEPGYLDWIQGLNDIYDEKLRDIIKKYKTKNKHIDIIFDGMDSATKKRNELKDKVRQIISKTKYKVEQDDENFLLQEIFRYHPNVFEKILSKKIDYIIVGDDEYKKNKCFFLYYNDKTFTDISWVKCLDNRFKNHFDTFTTDIDTCSQNV